MLVKLSVGIGSFGKLWTGTELRPAHEDPKNKLWDGKAQEVIPNIVDAFIMERTCECGASTRKFRATAVHQSEEASRAIDVPECFITAGGVGSICAWAGVSDDITTWNWSHRTGGHVILSPVIVVSGYVSREELPATKPGLYEWIQTYGGSTLSEYVLLRADQGSHALPIVKLSGKCPPCRQKREEAERAGALPEPVELANDGQCTR